MEHTSRSGNSRTTNWNLGFHCFQLADVDDLLEPGLFPQVAKHTHLDGELQKLGEGLGKGRAIAGPYATSHRLGE